MPVAMGGVDASGPNQSIEIVVPAQPTFKTGFTILAAGAVIGAVLGIALRQPPRVEPAAATESFPPPPAIVIPAPAPTASLVVPPPVAPEVKDVREAKSEKAEKKHSKGHSRKSERAEKIDKSDKDDGYRVASAEPTTQRDAKEAKEPPPSKKTSAASPPKAASPAPAKGNDDALNVIKAATGTLENTL
jgi:hypothetical protein